MLRSVGFCSGRRSSLLRRRDDDDDDDDDGDDDADDDLHLHVLPEVLALDLDGRAVELLGALLECWFERRLSKERIISPRLVYTHLRAHYRKC